MFNRFKDASLPAKLVTVFSVGAILGFGLCSTLIFDGGDGGGWRGRLVAVGAHSFYFCLLGVTASLIWWGSSKRKKG